MNLTCRQLSAPRPTVLSNDMPVKLSPSSGTEFHSLHATSQALQPMQMLVSVKKPIRGGASVWPASRATSCSGPYSIFLRSSSVMASDLQSGFLGDAGSALIVLDVTQPRLAARAAAGPDVGRERLDLLDVHVGVEAHRRQLVEGVTLGVAVGPPVVGHPDLVHHPAV